ncbi:xylulokinase [Paenibacillus silvisoli]|uniref:xylulokinase n=1 Tax=Paenibacillus silvisoli TaxID=3110539 RepID=UPI002805D229|nr:FGGY family carbohydrate kinase [Paenibacillus silvisoli]
MERGVIVGVDIGTSGVRAAAFSIDGEMLAEGRSALQTNYRDHDQAVAEQAPADWWLSSIESLRLLAGRLGALVDKVEAIGLTGQCPTFTLLSRSGATVGPGILYQDNRAVSQTEHLIRTYGKSSIHSRSGQAASPFYIAPKLLWLKANEPASMAPGTAILQPRDYVGWHMTGRLATDPTHAACTLLYDLNQQGWSKDWISDLDLDTLHWPEILDSDSLLGCLSKEAAAITGFKEGLPIFIGAADSICAAYGAQMTEVGDLCDVTGTSTCLHLLVDKPVELYEVNTYPYIGRGELCAEVGLNTTGEALRWLSRTLNVSIDRLLMLASSAQPGCGGLLFLPHLSGERDDPGRPGSFIGLNLGHTQAHLARAVLEGVAYAMRERMELLRKAGCQVNRIISCGGGSQSPLWNQIKADIMGLPLRSVQPADTTALGAALIGAKGVGINCALVPSKLTPYFAADTIVHYERNYKQFVEMEKILSRTGTFELA